LIRNHPGRASQAKIFPISKYGILPGKKRDPVTGVDDMIMGHSPVVNHDQLHPLKRDLQGAQKLGKGSRGQEGMNPNSSMIFAQRSKQQNLGRRFHDPSLPSWPRPPIIVKD